jgi:Kef-type K+ transport system membrane component KefB
MTNHELAITVFLQLAVLLAFVKVVARAVVFIGQPPVVGEMIAGFLVGPTLLGHLFPEFYATLFPKQAVSVLYVLSQIGLVLYMFLVGAEFDLRTLGKRKRAALSISVAGIVVPFALGAVLAWFIHDNSALFAPSAGLFEVMFFTGAAMSITAFPMLARIIRERGLTHSSMGTLALAAGSLDDAAAWCILALVVGTFSGSVSAGLLAIGGGIAYFVFCAFVLRPVLRRSQRLFVQRGRLHDMGLGALLVLLCLGAWFTDLVGIYAVFGAFIFGACMPRGVLVHQVSEKVEPLAKNLLLPLFFVYAGLNMRLDILVDPELLGLTAAVLVCACLGKFVACFAAARFAGETTRSALGIGALMNARGLMELILLNIALEHGIITNQMFTVMAIMAVVTTLMATPLFNFVTVEKRSEEPLEGISVGRHVPPSPT